MASPYQEFNQYTGEKEAVRLVLKMREHQARRFGFFELACMLQNAGAVLDKEGSTRRDFWSVLLQREHGFSYWRKNMQELDELLREEAHLHRMKLLPTPFENFVNSPSPPVDPDLE